MEKNISKIAYELYKQNWIDAHTTTKERLNSLANYYIESDEQDEEQLYEDWLYEVGFNGEIYVSYDEFLDNEYLEEDYMKEVLNNEILFKIYLEDLKTIFI